VIENLLLAVGINQLWYSAPLVVTVSLVYAATRHEELVPILQHALRFGTWIVVFMGIVLLILLILGWAV